MGMSVLELDAGNSRIKWRLQMLDAGGAIAGGVAPTLEALSRSLSLQAKPARIRAASVRDVGFECKLHSWAQQRWGLEVGMARVTAVCAGVTNAYVQPGQMGVDRWLAMIAAYVRVRQACCIVDCGTALTVDVIAHDGRHLGGYIVPGLQMQRRAITAGTAIRLPAAPGWGSIAPGCSTVDAVESGILASLVAFLCGHPQVREAANDNALFVTGGDEPVFAPWLRQQGLRWHNAPDLVLDGLRHVLP